MKMKNKVSIFEDRTTLQTLYVKKVKSNYTLCINNVDPMVSLCHNYTCMALKTLWIRKSLHHVLYYY